MSYVDALIHGYVRQKYEIGTKASKLVPEDIKLIFCHYFGYNLCCVAVAEQCDIAISETQFAIQESELLKLYTLHDMDESIIALDALFSAVINGHTACLKYIAPKIKMFSI